MTQCIEDVEFVAQNSAERHVAVKFGKAKVLEVDYSDDEHGFLYYWRCEGASCRIQREEASALLSRRHAR